MKTSLIFVTKPNLHTPVGVENRLLVRRRVSYIFGDLIAPNGIHIAPQRECHLGLSKDFQSSELLGSPSKKSVMIVSLKTFLMEQGVNETTPAERIKTLKAIYKKSYHKKYEEDYKKKHKRVKLSMTNQEHKRLVTMANKSGQRLAAFVKKAALAYLDKEYIVEDNLRIRELTSALRQLGNNLNQIAYNTNVSRIKGVPVDKEYIDGAFGILKRVQEHVHVALKSPREIEDYIIKRVEENPEFKDRLFLLLNKNV